MPSYFPADTFAWITDNNLTAFVDHQHLRRSNSYLCECAASFAFPSLLFLLFAGSALLFPGTAAAQDVRTESPAISIDVGGTVQARMSYFHEGYTDTSQFPPTLETSESDDRFGFALRRARLRVDATIRDRFGAYLQLDGADGTVGLRDALVRYALTDALDIRAGKFQSAGPQANNGTSHTRIDGIERPYIARFWENATLGGGGRSIGVDLHYQTESAEAMVFLHNGGARNVRPAIEENFSVGESTTGMAVSASAAYSPPAVAGLEVGGYAGYNAAEPESTSLLCIPSIFCDPPRSYASYAGHVYWGAAPGSRPIRAKLDVISIDFEEFARGGQDPDAIDQHTFGISLLGAAKVLPATEVYARVEQYDDGLDELHLIRTVDGEVNVLDRRPYRFLSAGINFSPSALAGRPFRQARLTLGYTTALDRPEEDLGGLDISQHLFVLQAQLVF